MDDVIQLLRKSRSAKNVKHVAALCVDDPDGFDTLIKIMEGKDQRLAWIAGWAMSHAVGLDKSILTMKQHKRLIRLADKTTDGAIKRNIMRAWQLVKLPGDLAMQIADIAFRFLSNPREEVAVKAFSMTVLQNCLEFIPEMKEEIMFVIEKDLPHGTAAYKVRASKFMKAAAKIRN